MPFVAMFTSVRRWYDANQPHDITLVMQRDKRGRLIVSAKVLKKIKHFGVDSTVDNELADEKLQTLDEVGVADRCLNRPFWPPCFL
jgi:ribosomal protein L28